MSETTPASTDLQLAIAHMDRAIEETRKFVAEREKLMAEREKLSAEAAKLNRERFLAPALALAATLGAIAAITPTILRALGAP